MIDEFATFISIKKHNKKTERKEIEVKQEVPINPEIYYLIIDKDPHTSISEFNNAYNLVSDLRDEDITIEDMVNLVYNHIIEIRNSD